MTTQDALVHLSHACAEAVENVLRTFCGEDVAAGGVAVVPKGSNPLATLRPPLVAAEVSYVDGVAGGHLFAIPLAGARRLAAAMTDEKILDGDGVELTEVAKAAVGEAMNQVMAAATSATAEALGSPVEVGAVGSRTLEATDDALGDIEENVHITSVAFEIGGEACRLVQLVPRSFTVRVINAMAGDIEVAPVEPMPASSPLLAPDPAVTDAIRDVRLRVWAELGRTKMVTTHAVGLTPGAVVDLDRGVDDPVDLYVNGCRFGSGRLTLDDEEWVVEIVALEPLEDLQF
jgi:flagellar motor switch protein FliN